MSTITSQAISLMTCLENCINFFGFQLKNSALCWFCIPSDILVMNECFKFHENLSHPKGTDLIMLRQTPIWARKTTLCGTNDQ